IAGHDGDTRCAGRARTSRTEASVANENLAQAAVGSARGFSRIFRGRYGQESDEAAGRADGGKKIVVSGKRSGVVDGNQSCLRRALSCGASASVAQKDLPANGSIGEKARSGRAEC